MADRANISTRISLEGDADIKAKLQSLGAEGERALKQIVNAAEQGNPALLKFSDGVGRAFGGGATKGASAFREAIHLLHPALEEAGFGMGNLRALSVVAQYGLVGLGAAITGGIVVGLAKLGDESSEARQKVTALFANTELGKKVFGELEKSAGSTGRSIKDASDTYSTFTDLLQRSSSIRDVFPPGKGPLSSLLPGQSADAATTDPDRNLFNVLRAGSASNAEALTTYKGLLSSLGQNGGALTRAGFEGLPIGAQTSFSQTLGPALGRSTERLSFGESLDRSAINIQQLATGLSTIGPAAKKASEEARKEFTNLGDSFDRVWNNIKTTLGKSGTNKDLAAGLDSAASIINAAGKGLDVINNIPKPFDPMKSDADAAFAAIEQRAKAVAAAIKTYFLNLFPQSSSGASPLAESIGVGTAAGGATGGYLQSGTIKRFFNGGLIGLLGGGMIRGPGTGTSDSIIAAMSGGGHIRVSNGEYINDAKTVAHFGVPFFSGLKSLAAAPGHAMGGFLDHLGSSLETPSFATGGLALTAPTASPHFGTVDFRTNAGTIRGEVSRDLISELHKAAVEARIRQGGRAPSHY